MTTPKVSIIVPIYNVEQYLDRCMTTILNQTLKDIEIIMVDDGSPDNCPAMCNEYAKKDPRIKVIHKKNGGLGYARNSGMEVATGEYVAFVDSDDFVDVKMYETLYNKAKSMYLDTCYCSVNRYRSDGVTKDITRYHNEAYFTNREQVDKFLFGMLEGAGRYVDMSVWKAIYSREVINNNNITFVCEKDIASEDIFFHVDYLSQAKKVGYLPNPMYYYFVNTNSITTNYSERSFNAMIRMLYETESCLAKYYEPDEYKYTYYNNILRTVKLILKLEVSNNSKSRKEIIISLKNRFSDAIFQKITTANRYSSTLSCYEKVLLYLFKYNNYNSLYLLQITKSLIKNI